MMTALRKRRGGRQMQNSDLVRSNSRFGTIFFSYLAISFCVFSFPFFCFLFYSPTL